MNLLHAPNATDSKKHAPQLCFKQSSSCDEVVDLMLSFVCHGVLSGPMGSVFTGQEVMRPGIKEMPIDGRSAGVPRYKLNCDESSIKGQY